MAPESHFLLPLEVAASPEKQDKAGRTVIFKREKFILLTFFRTFEKPKQST